MLDGKLSAMEFEFILQPSSLRKVITLGCLPRWEYLKGYLLAKVYFLRVSFPIQWLIWPSRRLDSTGLVYLLTMPKYAYIFITIMSGMGGKYTRNVLGQMTSHQLSEQQSSRNLDKSGTLWNFPTLGFFSGIAVDVFRLFRFRYYCANTMGAFFTVVLMCSRWRRVKRVDMGRSVEKKPVDKGLKKIFFVRIDKFGTFVFRFNGSRVEKKRKVVWMLRWFFKRIFCIFSVRRIRLGFWRRWIMCGIFFKRYFLI